MTDGSKKVYCMVLNTEFHCDEKSGVLIAMLIIKQALYV